MPATALLPAAIPKPLSARRRRAPPVWGRVEGGALVVDRAARRVEVLRGALALAAECAVADQPDHRPSSAEGALAQMVDELVGVVGLWPAMSPSPLMSIRRSAGCAAPGTPARYPPRGSTASTPGRRTVPRRGLVVRRRRTAAPSWMLRPLRGRRTRSRPPAPRRACLLLGCGLRMEVREDQVGGLLARHSSPGRVGAHERVKGVIGARGTSGSDLAMPRRRAREPVRSRQSQR